MELAQRQLDTFNAHDLEAFLPDFTDDVQILDLFDGSVTLRGIAAFRERYAAVFRERPHIQAELAGRMVVDRYVIDHERLMDGDEGPTQDAIAIYEVHGEQIARMWFLLPADHR